MGKEMTQERTARIAAEIASKTALDFYEKEKLREKKYIWIGGCIIRNA